MFVWSGVQLPYAHHYNPLLILQLPLRQWGAGNVYLFLKNILKVVFFLLQGGPPPAPPAAPRGAGLSARRLCKIRTQQNVEVYGRSEDETPRKCILQAENIMPGSKKLWEEHLFPSEKIVFSPFGRKNNHFFLRKQKFTSEFFCPWHKVSTQKEHIFLSKWCHIWSMISRIYT